MYAEGVRRARAPRVGSAAGQDEPDLGKGGRCSCVVRRGCVGSRVWEEVSVSEASKRQHKVVAKTEARPLTLRRATGGAL